MVTHGSYSSTGHKFGGRHPRILPGCHSRGQAAGDQAFCPISRRRLLQEAGASLAGLLVAKAGLGQAVKEAPPRRPNLADRAPTSPVAIRRCRSYDPQEVYRELSAAIDAVGGLRDLVAGKTVVVKVNMTGPVRDFDGRPASETFHIHPTFVEAFCALADQAGARRIVIVEALYYREPMEEILRKAGWDLNRLQSAGGHKVIWENTKNMGSWKKYSRLTVPWGGYLYPAFDVNCWYEKADVLVSLAKLKDHGTAGVTMAIKNMFGILPTALYGDDAPNEDSLRARVAILHMARRKVPEGVPAEVGPEVPTDPLVRVPRVTVDIFGIRPADLCIVDGVLTIKNGEGFWNEGVARIEPHLLIVGRNGVCTDAVCAAVMGYNPQAEHGTFPFPGENHLQLAAEAGLGTNDLSRIEVRGLSIKEALCPFRTAPPRAAWEGFGAPISGAHLATGCSGACIHAPWA
ncbi:MAG: DUF362 domain-containing protein [Thermoguttaceae bacterium]|nr:DUF362 domain-containing protein [Thermoguttaceae bacterium]MDW8079405.1 DUF362 domain-containing protein [Thermoguttaceae bacterium]